MKSVVVVPVLVVLCLPGAAYAQTHPATDELTLDAAATQPATAPTTPYVEGGLVEYIAAQFAPHEPIYFIWGPEDPEIKFQISLKYRIFSNEADLGQLTPWVRGFYLAYTQTSFWDRGAESGPFFDSSYKPELLYLYENERARWMRGMSRFDLQLALQHESNGKAGAESRSINIWYIRPVFTFGDGGTGTGLFLAIAPRLLGYFSKAGENDDIQLYRGFGDLRVITGWRDGLQLAATGRIGSEDVEKGSLELDVSYPLRRLKLLRGALDMYAYAQYFTGYGESLLEYNQRTNALRVGVALVR